MLESAFSGNSGGVYSGGNAPLLGNGFAAAENRDNDGCGNDER